MRKSVKRNLHESGSDVIGKAVRYFAPKPDKTQNPRRKSTTSSRAGKRKRLKEDTIDIFSKKKKK
jgi:hypothetical protein